MKTLVIFYSLEGSCRYAAKRIADACGADLLELKPVKDIKAGKVTKYFWGGRQAKQTWKKPSPVGILFKKQIL